MGKTNPLNDDDLQPFVTLQKTRKKSEQSWLVKVKSIDSDTYDLSVRNPNAEAEKPLREPQAILTEMHQFDEQNAGIMKKLQELIV